MTSDHDALLRAISEHPREDTPRLAFADWLEENADAFPAPAEVRVRAAFIRTDIAMAAREEWELERIRHETGLNERVDFKLAWSWSELAALSGGFAPTGNPIARRGFPYAALVPHRASLLDRPAELFDRSTVEHLVFGLHQPDLNRLVAARWFPRMTGLSFRETQYNPHQLAPILDRPHQDLTELSLTSGALTAPAVAALFASPLFGQLTALSLSGHSGAARRAILDALTAPPPTRLRTLDLSKSLPGANHTQMLAALRLPPTVQSLELSHNHLNADRTRILVDSAAFTDLKVLKLASNPVGNAGATALFTSPHLADLKVLDLSYCQVGDEALRTLLDNSPHADGLNFLNLAGSPASAEMKQAVKDRMGDRVRV